MEKNNISRLFDVDSRIVGKLLFFNTLEKKILYANS